MLEEAAAMAAVIPEIVRRPEDSFVARAKKLQRIICDEGTHRARIHPPFRRRRNRARKPPLRAARE